MKRTHWICPLTVTLIFFMLITSCKKDKPVTKPVVKTVIVASLTSTTATVEGNIISDGGAAITSRGVLGMSLPPESTDSPIINGKGTGSFASYIRNLRANTTYYVQAYATNSAGTSFGDFIYFKTQSIDKSSVTDYDGNVYHTVTIGAQVWMVENLKTTKYNDGTVIPNVTSDTVWAALTTPAYCSYTSGPFAGISTYGALYNWFAVNTGKLCPIGWHVPSYPDWFTLISYLGGENVAGVKLKDITHWNFLNSNLTNETGFTARPGGYRDVKGKFNDLGVYCNWWTSIQDYPVNEDIWENIDFIYLYNNDDKVWAQMENVRCGLSVRCLRD